MNSEMLGQLQVCSDELEDIRCRLEKIDVMDQEYQYLQSYALIRACGVAEYVCHCIVADYFTRFHDPVVDKYIDDTVRNSSFSVKYSVICKTLKSFNDQWASAFKNEIDALDDRERIISSSNSLVSVRHAFAHGRTYTAAFEDIKRYYDDVIVMLEILYDVVNVRTE